VNQSLEFVILGLSLTSSWGNGHATTYRALLRELIRRGHRVLFLERDVAWYANNRDLPEPSFGELGLYQSFDELVDRFGAEVRSADVVIVGSYVPEGARVGTWVTSVARGKTAFYDIDTPVTMRDVRRGVCEYLSADLIPRFDLYLSFTGGPILKELETRYGAIRARPLYCGVDPEQYFPETRALRWDLGYLGTYSADRHPALDGLLLSPARDWPNGRFIVAGPLYPPDILWPRNVERLEHLPPPSHRAFYNAQRFTLNVTRADMARAGWSPSVRIFEAAACGTPIVSDSWPGLDSFLVPGREILVARGAREALAILRSMPEQERLAIGRRARARVVAEHSAACRAEALEGWIRELSGRESQRTTGLSRRVSGGAMSEGP
jgi:spore maturation protein CgeB